MPNPIHPIKQDSDHDLLIRQSATLEWMSKAHTESLDRISKEIGEIKGMLSSKADSSDLEQVQARLADLEKTVGTQGTALTAATASANSSVKTIGTFVGWGGGLVTIMHYCGWIK